MNRERVLGCLVQIDLLVHEAQRQVMLDGVDTAGSVLSAADHIRQEADDLGQSVWTDALAVTATWRSWGPQTSVHAQEIKLVNGLPFVVSVGAPALEPGSPAPSTGKGPALSKVRKGKLAERDNGAAPKRRSKIVDALPLEEFIQLREAGQTYREIAESHALNMKSVANYGLRALPKHLRNVQRPAEGEEAGDED